MLTSLLCLQDERQRLTTGRARRGFNLSLLPTILIGQHIATTTSAVAILDLRWRDDDA